MKSRFNIKPLVKVSSKLVSTHLPPPPPFLLGNSTGGSQLFINLNLSTPMLAAHPLIIIIPNLLHQNLIAVSPFYNFPSANLMRRS
ncbi:hypothetical protein L2E82_11065 [Cichorium intybus]|uniref:Uncharacterized protein n=1 Tax=Cichorium intybus TaxID=13427 RepID=A0ACB9GDB2_CICIN|nr:hypothetical protein L2E82_11065 [Cichorium intybus]